MSGILDKIKSQQPTPSEPNHSLEKHEIEFLLLLIKDSSFKGDQVEILYNIAYKLQQQYLNK